MKWFRRKERVTLDDFEPPPPKIKPPPYEGRRPNVGKCKELLWRVEHGDERFTLTAVITALLRAVVELDR